jgi:hypothetical protein
MSEVPRDISDFIQVCISIYNTESNNENFKNLIKIIINEINKISDVTQRDKSLKYAKHEILKTKIILPKVNKISHV